MDPAGVKFVLMVNKQGHTRFSKWMQHVEDDPHRRRMMEFELVRKCMPRDVDHVRSQSKHTEGSLSCACFIFCNIGPA
jgi:sensor domain CHASE-containing protein